MSTATLRASPPPSYPKDGEHPVEHLRALSLCGSKETHSVADSFTAGMGLVYTCHFIKVLFKIIGPMGDFSSGKSFETTK